MPATKRSDFFRQDILAEAVQAGIAGMKALYGTGAATMDGSLGSRIKGDKIQVPYWGVLGEMEDLPSDESNVTDGIAGTGTLQKLTSTSQQALVNHSRLPVELTRWAEMSVSYGDPYQHMADQMVERVRRRIDKALIDIAFTTTLAYDATALAVKTFTWSSVVNAKGQFGDEIDAQGGIALGVFHSKQATDAENLVDSQNRPLLVNPVDGSLTRVGNIPFTRSDRLEILPSTAPKTYNALIIKPQALMFWYNNDALSVKVDEDIMDDSTVGAVHLYWAVHMYNPMPGMTRPGVLKLKTQ